MKKEITIKTEGLTKVFGNFTAVDQISFEVTQGEVFGFLGANGAGKTTAIKMLIGLSRPTRGKAQVGGYDVYTQAELIKKNIGYMSQKFSLYEDLSIRQNIRFYGGIYGLGRNQLKRKSEEIIASLQLQASANKLVGDLPLGWKQRLAFAVSGIHDPKIIFMDEPTGGVDPVTRRQFWEMIYESANKGITIFVTTHYMDEAEYCNRVSIMVAGKMEAIGTPTALKEQFAAQSMDEVFVNLVRGEH